MLAKVLRPLTRLAGAFLCLSVFSTAVHADSMRIFACEPEWASLAEELVGPKSAIASQIKAKIYSATTALQDAHALQARPSLIAQMRQADLMVCTGASLEVGWLPVLLTKSNNPRVLPGKPGHFMASNHVQLKEIPKQLDRSMGDVHAEGNPHIQTDPRNILLVAKALTKRLAQIHPAHAAGLEQSLADFERRWGVATERWTQQGQVLRGLPIVVQHKSWVYMNEWLGLNVVATLEPKPGVPPSVSHLNKVLQQLKNNPARLILRAPYQNDRASQWLQKRSGLPEVVVPFMVGEEVGAPDLFALFDVTLERLLKVASR